MRGLDDLVPVRVADATLGHGQLDAELESLGLFANMDTARDRSVGRELDLELLCRHGQGAAKARSVATGEQLFGVGSWATYDCGGSNGRDAIREVKKKGGL